MRDLPAVLEVLVGYRLTTRIGAGFERYTNCSIGIFPAGKPSLKEVFASVRAGGGQNRKLLKSGEIVSPHPAVYPHYSTQSRDLSGLNEDGFLEIALDQHGSYFVECSCSFADNGSNVGLKALADFKKKLKVGQ